MTSSNNNETSKPFDWLHGGLFFGVGSKKGGGIESIDSEKDVSSLLQGIHDNFEAMLSPQQEATANAGVVSPPLTDGKETENNSMVTTTSDDADFLAARLARLRFLLYDERRGTSSQYDHHHHHAAFGVIVGTVTTPSVALTTVQNLAAQHPVLIPQLIQHLSMLPFESRKHVAAIFNYLLVCGLEGNDRDLYLPIMNAYKDFWTVSTHFDTLLQSILHGYQQSVGGGGSGSGAMTPATAPATATTTSSTDVLLHCGSMYRSCFKHVSLYRELVATPERVARYVFPFLDQYALLANFDVASDAMENLQCIMTAGSNNNSSSNDPEDERQQQVLADLCATFLTRDYVAIWDDRFNPDLLNDQTNYMTKRLALQILSTVLLTRSNYAIMIRYVNSRSNLILVMKLLRDTSPHITLDAFHVFKVFVANPQKIPEVEKILRDNQQKLCTYLETLHQDRETSDPQFAEEKALIIATIRGL